VLTWRSRRRRGPRARENGRSCRPAGPRQDRCGQFRVTERHTSAEWWAKPSPECHDGGSGGGGRSAPETVERPKAGPGRRRGTGIGADATVAAAGASAAGRGDWATGDPDDCRAASKKRAKISRFSTCHAAAARCGQTRRAINLTFVCRITLCMALEDQASGAVVRRAHAGPS
jgi:hypothetical protein